MLGADAAGRATRASASSPAATRRTTRRASSSGKNLLYTATSIEDDRAAHRADVDEVVDVLGRRASKLFEARARRPRPHLDDKVLTAWNGLMIAAFARAARVLDGAEARTRRPPPTVRGPSAPRAFVRRVLWRGRHRHACCAASAPDTRPSTAYSEDYAILIWGLLELFQATGDGAVAGMGDRRCRRRQDELFWDDADGGWFSTTGDDASVLLRLKEEYDGAEPAASSLTVQQPAARWRT